MANISHLVGSSHSKFRALNKQSDMWRALYYQPQSVGRADALCLSKLGHLSLKYILSIQPLLLDISSPRDRWGWQKHLLANDPMRSELCLSDLGLSPSLESAREGPHASAETARDPWALNEPSVRTRHRRLDQGNTFLGVYMKNDHFFAFREKPTWLQLKYYFCLARHHFHSWKISRQE